MGLELDIVVVETLPSGQPSITQIIAEMEARIRVIPIKGAEVKAPDRIDTNAPNPVDEAVFAAKVIEEANNSPESLSTFTANLLNPLCKPYLLALKDFLESEELRLSYCPTDLKPQVLGTFFKKNLQSDISKSDASTLRQALVGKKGGASIGYAAVFNIIDELCVTAAEEKPVKEVYVNPAYEPQLIAIISKLSADTLPPLRDFLANMQQENACDVGEFQVQELMATIPNLGTLQIAKDIRQCILGVGYKGGLRYKNVLNLIDQAIEKNPSPLSTCLEKDSIALSHDKSLASSPITGQQHLSATPAQIKKAVEATLEDDPYAHFREARKMLIG